MTTAESEWAVLFNKLNTEYTVKQRASRKCSEVMMEVMNDERMFLTLSKIAKFGLILPVNTAACERGFSQLKLIKTPHRNRLKQSTLDNLMMIATEGPPCREFDYEKAVNHWAGFKKKKTNFYLAMTQELLLV